MLGGMELVSPIYEFRDPDTWESKLQLVWEVLKNGFETSTNDDCSTHVHISPAGQDTAFTLGQAKKIAKAVVYYERCVDSIMPDKRRVKLYCRSNRYTSAFDGKEMPEVFEMIDAIPSTEKLALLMNIYKEPGMFLKFFRWNFENLRPGMKGTIEFRQPPGSVDDQDSRFWILFTRAYVHAAMLYGDKIDPAKPVQDLRVFRDFILDGAKDAGMSVRNQATLAKPFEEKALFPEVRFKLTNEDEDSVEYKAEMESLAREENLSFDEVKYRYSTYTTSAAQYN